MESIILLFSLSPVKQCAQLAVSPFPVAAMPESVREQQLPLACVPESEPPVVSAAHSATPRAAAHGSRAECRGWQGCPARHSARCVPSSVLAVGAQSWGERVPEHSNPVAAGHCTGGGSTSERRLPCGGAAQLYRHRCCTSSCCAVSSRRRRGRESHRHGRLELLQLQ